MGQYLQHGAEWAWSVVVQVSLAVMDGCTGCSGCNLLGPWVCMDAGDVMKPHCENGGHYGTDSEL